ncbi:AAA family ATPase [Campylobacter geochelonis]|uniref:AAA family ATPase n=1 Tax=Campylobacter geochelonis TaxID=1780362 RepID=UPI0007708117|nr:AAA family ATPase [Campylobacter geochelonis]CZE50507.1 histidinol phosphatase [Campylobacter geochelonis]
MKIVSVVSGKGGVGKSLISANLANIIANEGYKVVLIDADLSLGSLDTILNVKSEKNIFDFFKGEAKFEDVMFKIKPNLYIVPSYSGEEILAIYNDELKQNLKNELLNLQNIDFIFIDTSSGISKITQDFIDIADEVLLTSVPEPTAMIDAYATLKIVTKYKNKAFLMLNLANGEGEVLCKNFAKVLKNNVEKEFDLSFVGELKQDDRLLKSVKDREIFSDEYQSLIALNQLKQISSNLLVKMGKKAIKVESIKGISGFFKRILDLV